ncbi:MAG: hypothetical protein GVY27_13315 [Deinococcus-Thermus bacterium]|jgi:hypothetical protein|nr:hypothetical protein [Deinococcota bacterium]
MAFIDTVGERLAVAAFEQAQATDDPDLVDEVSRTIGVSSPTLQEVYDTCIRYLRAEARAQEFMQRKYGGG